MSLNKKQSSTYIKYACGCFLYAPSIYSVYLQKRLLQRANSTTFLQTINDLIKHGKKIFRSVCFIYQNVLLEGPINPKNKTLDFEKRGFQRGVPFGSARKREGVIGGGKQPLL